MEVLVALVGGTAFAAVFVLAELGARAPMRLFRSRAFSAGNAVIFLLNAALTGSVFLTAHFLQVGLGHRPLAAGLGLLPWGIAPFLIAPRAGALVDRIGERPLILAGLLLGVLIAPPDRRIYAAVGEFHRVHPAVEIILREHYK